MFIDAPFGVDMKQLSRIDVAKLVPKILKESFIIIIDDTNRIGETNCCKMIEGRLKESGIEFCQGSYQGDKKTTVICSTDYKYLCSL